MNLPEVNVDILFTFKTIRMLLHPMLLYCIKQIFFSWISHFTVTCESI